MDADDDPRSRRCTRDRGLKQGAATTLVNLVSTMDFTLPFTLRGVEGAIHVRYGVNDDPRRWGYEVLDLDWYSEDVVRGFPVMQASVEHSAEGYAAQLGWVQVVEYHVRDPGQSEDVTVFDVPPQLSEIENPYFAFGVLPTVFDAPSITSHEVEWSARTFLTYTPDAVLSRVIAPLGGFTWGYDVTAGEVTVRSLATAEQSDWMDILPGLRLRFPSWSFLD